MFNKLFSKSEPESRRVPVNDPSIEDAIRQVFETNRMIDAGCNAYLDDNRRQAWFRQRLWHRGPHAQCCKRCFQAGYVLALLRAGRPDLIGEFPELIAVHEELQRDGMTQCVPACR